MDYKRASDETKEEYILRICGLKDVIGVTWDRIAAIINENLGIERTESSYRKFYARHANGLPLNIDAETAQSLNIQSERNKLHTTKVELNRYLRHYSRFDLFYENIRDAIETLPPPEVKPFPAKASDKEYILTISDLHYGSTYTSENNRYSRDICRQRLNTLLGEVIEFVKYEGVEHLNVVSLGDTIQGILRLTDLQLNDIAVVDCVVEISRILAAFLNELTAYVYVDYYAVSAANHTQTRPIGSKASELATEDVERIIINYISDLLADNGRACIHTDMSRDYIDFSVFDFQVIAMHGHQIKNLPTAIKDMSSVCQKFYDYMLLGHLHSAQELCVGERDEHNIEVLVSPSIIGSCPYSDKLLKGSKSAAKIYEFDERHGHTMTKTIILN